ncbi:MAG: PCMD domain-containing protein [Pseudoflavonifractor sp.]|nr:PCMD domain-containing protein [Alloprevotella sp.]MCM1116530.1 PCMD domain-containing protein [Pseudoflavonifractor sp.]
MNKRMLYTMALWGYLGLTAASAGPVEKMPYGDFEQWTKRLINESVVIGGDQKTVYAIGPDKTVEGNKPYHPAGVPWATSNVYAKVSGVTKGSNAVYPFQRTAGNRCAKLCTQFERVKVLGLINMDVMVAGSIFLGKMIEPVTGTKNPYSKMEMGVPFTKRPSALVFDYMLDMPAGADTRVKATGFGGKKTLPGSDEAVAFIILQRRWEDADGNLHATRVATGAELFSKGCHWVDGHKVALHYGDTSNNAAVKWLPLRSDKSTAYYARNSKGKMVPVIEERYDSADATPTHMIVMFSSGNGEPYVGTPGLTFYVDNVALAY